MKKIGELLVEKGMINKQQLEVALAESKRTKRLLGEVLVHLGFVSSDQISKVLASQSGQEYINLRDYEISEEALKLVPEFLAREHSLIPLMIEDKTITVAMANPYDVIAMDKLKELTGRRVKPLIADRQSIHEAIDLYYSLMGSLEETIHQVVDEASTFRERPLGDEASPVVKMLDLIITRGLLDKATDIHITPEENISRVLYRIDGLLSPELTLPKNVHPSLITRIKILSNLNISESRLPQDGKILFKVKGREVDVRVSTFPTPYGEAAVMRLLDKSSSALSLENLGFTPEQMSILKQMIVKPHGMILVTGPTGSGKSTTLYAMLMEINSIEKNIITLEDPIEYQIPLIRQSQVNVQAGFTFAVGLRSILRQDPDVIMVGEMRDTETAELAIRAALTGHLVISTLHTNDTPSAVTRLIDMGIEPHLIPSVLLGVVGQRLARKICAQCREEYVPTPEELEQYNLNQNNIKTLFRGKGCPRCKGNGYKGRMALAEILVPNEEIENLILNRAASSQIRRVAIRSGMKGLWEDGVEKALRGLTTLEEVRRVIG